ncbi:phage major capsid protein [Ruegeria sp. HKCCD6604]|uniref:phage major capsid protein n=1 Tax=Ruegeria sp. HKCCD6604 TaxID=2683000 RepID=UPI001490CC21|nr:phage major capsid protein [Ruegeria sp. HKCCD6604]NOC91567.1 phage major capsid protein [Ruegeria sp. HKCCD6604]
MPKTKLVEGELHNPAFEKQGNSYLQKRAYEIAVDDAEKTLEEAPEVVKQLPGIVGRIEALEERPVKVNVKAEIKPPAEPKQEQKKLRPMELVVASVGAEFLRVAANKDYNASLLELLPGNENRASRKAVKGMLEKSATGPATTTAAGWAAELVESDVLDLFVDMAANSVIGALAPRARVQEFGRNRSITIPVKSPTRDIHAGFVGEGNTIAVKSGSFGSSTLYAYKAAVISTFTNELAETSRPNIQTVIRESVIEDTSDFLDRYFLDPAKTLVAAIEPGSPFNGAPNQASAGGSLDNVLTDLKFLIGSMLTAKARTPVLIVNPVRLLGLQMLKDGGNNFVFREDIAAGQLWGVPFVASVNCPEDIVYVIDADTLVLSGDMPITDTSASATLVMANDDGVAPTMVETDGVTDAGSIHISDAAGTTPPSEVRSVFQMNATALRYVLPISWGNIVQRAAYITAVGW